MRIMPTLARMLGASVISSLFVSIIFLLFVFFQSISEAFFIESLKLSLGMFAYALIVSFVTIVVLGVPIVIFLLLIKNLNFKYISVSGFLLGFFLLYLLLKGGLSSSNKFDTSGYFFCGVFGLVSAATACVFYKTFILLKKKDNNIRI